MHQLERVALELKQVQYVPNEPIAYVYFSLTTVHSLLVMMGDGSSVEVGMVGNEGMLGLPVFLGAPMTTGKALCQIAGEVQ